MAKETLKERSLGKSQVIEIGQLVSSAWEEFDSDEFVSQVYTQSFEVAGILERVRIISEILKIHLPKDYLKSIEILLNTLRNSPSPSSLFGDFIYAPFGEFVGKYGCSAKYLECSLNALSEMTLYYTSEFPMRQFLLHYPNETYKTLEIWTSSPKEQLRRLTSECTRPLLPWATKLNLPLDRNISVLQILKNDTSEFVLRSVGNHLDDIAKVETELAISTLKNWSHDVWRKDSAKLIKKHATRYLLRSGNKNAFEIIGLNTNPSLDNFNSVLSSNHCKIGEEVTLSLTGLTKTHEDLYIDAVFLVPAAVSGKKNSKVLKIRSISTVPEEPFNIKYRLKLIPNSRLRLRTGDCSITVRINGISQKTICFSIYE